MSTTNLILETKNLTVGIGPRVFCQSLNLSLALGESLAILGCNGVGKSTLLSVLTGLNSPTSGEIFLRGQTYADWGARDAAKIRGYLPQARGDAFATTVLEMALSGRHPHLDRWEWESPADARIVRAALARMGLAELESRDIQTLSGGERQRLAVATLLAQAPQLFLLDEPTTHLDLNHQMSVLQLFSDLAKQGDSAVAMVLHDPSLALRFCDRALLIYGEGETEIGRVEEMLTVERLSRLYRYPLQKLECGEYVSFIPE